VAQFQGAVLREGLVFGECPRWHDGRLWYSDFYEHAVHALTPGGADERVAEVPGQPSGLGWMPDGSLLIVSMTDRRVLRRSPDGSLSEHADLSEHAPFHCNDMVVDAAGRAYVGNFGFDLFALRAGERVEPRAASLIRVDPGGQVSVAAGDLQFPNGSVITPDGQTLIVAETMARRLTAFDISGDGTLGGRRVWADLAPHQIAPDGICLDASGAVWVANAASTTAVRVAEGGGLLDTAEFSQTCIACMLGGPDGRELFAMTAPPTIMPEELSASPRARIESARVDVGHAGLP
jgi:sugar lactone lactonase YvrE